MEVLSIINVFKVPTYTVKATKGQEMVDLELAVWQLLNRFTRTVELTVLSIVVRVVSPSLVLKEQVYARETIIKA